MTRYRPTVVEVDLEAVRFNVGRLLPPKAALMAVVKADGYGHGDVQIARAVLDADGLNAFTGRASELAERRADLVLTPHAGEFARLSGGSAREVALDRVGSVRALAAETGATVLLKGSRTLVGTPEGHVRVNSTGGPYLATGGTGDVLTGAIAGLLARGLAPIDAASVAAFLHGRAGALAAARTGEGTAAGDVLDQLASALREVHPA